MPPIKGQMFRYTEDDMETAIEEVLRGQPVSTTAKKYGIPRVTLLYKSKGKTPRQRRMGPQPYLKDDQENILVKWIMEVANAGFPVQHHQLMSSVQVLMKHLNQKNPFKDDKPGRTWLTSFLKRHPEISTRVAQNLTSTRAAVTKEAIVNWFQEVYSYLQENNYADIIKDPSRVFNADETAFFLNPKVGKVLAKRGDKTVYQHVNPDEKECLTVLITGNAAGDLAQPMVVFKYERIPRELALIVPEQWGIGKSESGWMTGETFYEFITNIFDKWLTEKQITRPVILFIDGHSSHLTLHTSKFCAENNIVLVALHPNATHLIQPMDVAVFRSLKGGWKDAVHQWRFDNRTSPILRKIHFSPLLEKVLQDKLAPSILKNGFRKCGLFPWNPDAITFSSDKLDISKKEDELQEMKKGKCFLEKNIEIGKLILFKTNVVWDGDIQDVSLFNFYKNICAKCETLEEEIKIFHFNNIIENTEKQQLDPDETHIHQSHINEQTNVEQDEAFERNICEIVGETMLESDRCSAILEQYRSPTKKNPQDEQSFANIDEPRTSRQQFCSSSLTEPTSSDANIPTPFKRALFWPEPKQSIIKKRKVEKVPAVATSKAWQSYHENKENKKIKLMEEKIKRAEARRKKKEENDMLKKQKQEERKHRLNKKSKVSRKKNDYSSSSDNESWIESGDSIDDISIEDELEPNFEDTDLVGYEIGDYILVKFPGKKREHKYACIIQKIFPNSEAEIMAMNYINDSKTVFKTNDTDVSLIKYEQILMKLPQPEIITTGKRLKYVFPLSVAGIHHIVFKLYVNHTMI